MEENNDANAALNSEESTEEQNLNVADDQGNGEGENNEEANSEGEEEQKPQSRGERRETSYIDRLSEQIRNSSSSSASSQYQSTYKPLEYNEGGEVDLDELKRDREAYGSDQFNRGISEAQRLSDANRIANWATNFEFDTDRANRIMPELDETSDTFDPVLTEKLTKKFINFIGYNQDDKGKITVDRPNVRFLDFVKAEKESLDYYAGRASERSAKNISTQASNTGIRPNAQGRTASKGANMSYQELMKLSPEDWNKFGRAAADKILNERLGI